MEKKSTLVDEFLEDFESDHEKQEEEDETSEEEKEDKMIQEEEEEKEKEKEVNFQFSESLNDNLKKIQNYMKDEKVLKIGKSFKEDEEYEFVLKNNMIILKIDEEIINLHYNLKKLYSKKFKELEEQILNPLDYCRVIKKIGNLKDISSIDFSDILPSSICIVLKITFSTSKINEFSNKKEEELIFKICDEILKLEKIKKEILNYITSRMNLVAPNLSLIVGTKIASQLIGSAGGLEELSKIPAPNLQLLGRSKKNLTGFSSKSMINQYGFIGECDFVQNSPPNLRKKVSRIVSMKSSIASRIDSFSNSKQFDDDTNDNLKSGENLKREIEIAIEKLQIPPPAKQEKPLPVPIEKAKTRRGGKNARRMKEKYKPTLMMKKANRISFGIDQQVEDFETGKGFGMLGIEGYGNIKMKSKTKIKKKEWENKSKNGSSTAMNKLNETSSGFTTSSGISTSSGFTTSSAFNTTTDEFKVPSLKRNNEDGYFSNLKFKKLKK
eukprot:gene3444-6093_t